MLRGGQWLDGRVDIAFDVKVETELGKNDTLVKVQQYFAYISAYPVPGRQIHWEPEKQVTTKFISSSDFFLDSRYLGRNIGQVI